MINFLGIMTEKNIFADRYRCNDVQESSVNVTAVTDSGARELAEQ